MGGGKEYFSSRARNFAGEENGGRNNKKKRGCCTIRVQRRTWTPGNMSKHVMEIIGAENKEGVKDNDLTQDE